MAEKTNELNENPGILSKTDEDIISTVAERSGDEFVEKYTDKTAEAEATSDDPGKIRSQIEETRQEMGETIDEIQERLSYENISEEVSERVSDAFETAKDTVYDATIAKAGYFMNNVGQEIKKVGNEISKTEVGKTVMNNPVPFALIGLGAGILLINSLSGEKSSRSGSGRDDDYDSRRSADRTSMLKSAGEKVSSTASHTYESVSHAAERAYESAAQTASSAYQSVDDAAHLAYEKAGEYGKQAKEQYEYYIEENPLAVGAVAFAAGAAIGFAIPSSRYESKLLGEARDQLLQQARHQAKGLLNQAGKTAMETIDEARKSGEDATRTATKKVGK